MRNTTPPSAEGHSFRFASASGADPSRRKTRSRSIAKPPAAPKGGDRGFLPLSSAIWCSANRTALREGYASESVAWIMEKPRTYEVRRLAFRYQLARLFVTGTPAPPGDANREGTAFRARYVTTSTSVRSLSHSVLISYTTSREIRACYPLATSCIAEDHLEKLATFSSRIGPP